MCCSSVDRMAERKAKLAALHRKRNESRQLNHAEVVEEDRRSKEPKNMEVRKRRAAYLLEEEEFKAKCEAEGKDWKREQLRYRGADVAEAIDKQKRSKTDPDKGFSSYEEASFRKYNQLVKQIKVIVSIQHQIKVNSTLKHIGHWFLYYPHLKNLVSLQKF